MFQTTHPDTSNSAVSFFLFYTFKAVLSQQDRNCCTFYHNQWDSLIAQFSNFPFLDEETCCSAVSCQGSLLGSAFGRTGHEESRRSGQRKERAGSRTRESFCGHGYTAWRNWWETEVSTSRWQFAVSYRAPDRTLWAEFGENIHTHKDSPQPYHCQQHMATQSDLEHQ